jgi:protease-4
MADNPERTHPAHAKGDGPDVTWERQLVEKVLLANVTEQRRSRRWGLFFRGLLFAYLFAILALWAIAYLPSSTLHTGGHAAVVEIDGLISSETDASAEKLAEALRDAFEDKGTKGVILRINSPGGSPVQSAIINDEIRRLRDKHKKVPVYAVIEDLGASGAYYVAAAADKIYVNRSSVVGSIGVLMNGFGFVDTLEKLGIERRLLTAGEHKALFDPFSPVEEFDRAHLEQLLGKLHESFIAAVKAGRSNRLKDDPQIFSGLFWTGEESVELGLADGFGDLGYVARDVIGVETTVDFTKKEDVWERLAARLGTGAAEAFTRFFGWGGGVLGLR